MMTKEEKYDLAKWVMVQAEKKGANQVSVTVTNSRNNGVEIREGKIDKLEQANQNNLSIRLFVDNKYSAHSTNRMKKSELSRFIEEAIIGTRFLSEDKFRSLPDANLYYKGDDVNLKLLDTNFDKIYPQKKIDLAFNTEKEVLGKDKRIISVTSGYSDGLNERVLVTSNGFEGYSANSYYAIHSTVSVKGKEARPESYWNEISLFFDQLKTEGVGKIALERALKKIGQRKTESGKMAMIVENRQLGRILGPLIAALNGSAIQQKNSFLIDKLSKKVVSEKLTIYEDPFIISGRGSRLFDSEGLATKKRAVFENGVLKNYFIDTYYGKKLDMPPTNGSITNLVLKPGEKKLPELIASVKKGIMVTGFNGGNSNGSTGDFSYGIEGFLIENGEIVRPVSEMNITGNMLKLWSNIAEIGTDVNHNSSWLTPSVLFEEVDFSGN